MTAHDEALGLDTVDVEFNGNTYRFPASLDNADGDVLEAVDNMKLSHALIGLMSPADWKRFKATKPQVKLYAELFDAYAKRIGLGTTGE
jgi:hypothetical protein